MASSDPWQDYDGLKHGVKQNTVDRLKQIIAGLNEECSTLLSKGGKKQDLIDRIVQQLEYWRRSNSSLLWMRAKAVLYQVRNSGMYTASKMPADGTSYTAAAVAHNPYASSSSSRPNGYHPVPGAIPGSVGRYDPYAPPRKPSGPPASALPPPPKPTIRFKPSPFFRIDQAVSPIIECPESTGSMDRRQGSLAFSLNADQVAKLTSPGSKYQLRLYCTSSQFHSQSAFRPMTGLCPIEFPPTCEIRLNTVQLTASVKGLKKKPGTAPPPDLGKTVRTTVGGQNRIEMVYVNSQQGAPPKKYYLVVNLVETTSVEQLVDKLKKGKYKSSSEIMTKRNAVSTDDDDIVAESQKMTLKCPLSYTRISTPCRSDLCVHIQCFDATSFFSVMEQTTTWQCPVCEKVLNTDDLIVDGYFDEILKATSEDVDDVIVESDGQWHTTDNKFASAQWKALHPPVSPANSSRKPGRKDPPSRSPSKPVINGASTEPGGKGKGKAVDEIYILDSDDEDDDRVKRELSPSGGSSTQNSYYQSQATLPPQSRAQSQADNVIDLTLDSEDSDDEPAPYVPPTVMRKDKRKAPDDDPISPTEPIWKKSRPDVTARSNGLNGNGHINGASLSSSSAVASNNGGGSGYSLMTGILSSLVQRPSATSPGPQPAPPAPSRYPTLNNAAPSTSVYQYMPPLSPSLPHRSTPSQNHYTSSMPNSSYPRSSSSSRWPSS
ncbi:hypothetical protein JAAARDRAFT_29547 [Jaapia argillacea MUCL 33604]|uniref:SP-RING-type domain-containing protein n=1 Tax=Jaapia argillacea MUCL 33604 TaxID=933084 RepID=A0A067Q905_9AGAM|nr:hypothetical protein JAAARDRAFT_29547 [Jaapia argillacea MUCL 33604]